MTDAAKPTTKKFHLAVDKNIKKSAQPRFQKRDPHWELMIQVQLLGREAKLHPFDFVIENFDHLEDHKITVIDFFKNNYEVEVTDRGSRISSCSCAGFLFNQLGACLHTEAVKRAVEEIPEFRESFSRGKRTAPTIFHNVLLKALVIIGAWRRKHLDEAGLELTDRSDGIVEIKDIQKFQDFCQNHPEMVTGCVRTQILPRLLQQLRQKEQAERLGQFNLDELDFIRKPLYPFQKSGVEFLLKNRRAILADEMGSGKTIQSITAAEVLAEAGEAQRVLIVCPSSVKHHWLQEIHTSTDREGVIFFSSKDVKSWFENPGHDVYVIVNYELVQRNINLFATHKFDVVILDEAQRVRNLETKTWNAIRRLQSDFLFVLSGTLVENKLSDLFSIMEIIDRDFLGPRWKFDISYQEFDFDGKFIGHKNLGELRKKLSNKILRRLKKDVLKELPPIVEQTRYVPLTAEQRHWEDHYRSEAQKILAIGSSRGLTYHEKQIVNQCLLKARQACNAAELCKPDTKHPGSPKLDEFEDVVLESCQDSTRKILVFSDWVEMLQLAAKRLDKLGIGYVHFNGSIPTHKRPAIIEKFSQDPNIRIFLSSAAGGEGLNLQFASHVVHLDLPWNPAKLDQRTNRAHRIKQENTVLVTHLVAESGIERGIEGVLKSKRSVRGATLDAASEVEEVAFESFSMAMENALKR